MFEKYILSATSKRVEMDVINKQNLHECIDPRRDGQERWQATLHSRGPYSLAPSEGREGEVSGDENLCSNYKSERKEFRLFYGQAEVK